MAQIDIGQEAGTGGPALVRYGEQRMKYGPTLGPTNENIVRLVTYRRDAAQAYARSRYERFYRWEKLVNLVSKKKAWDWKANAFLPYAFSVAEQSAAIKWLALFLTRPYITVQARQPELEQIATRRQSLLEWRMTGDLDVVSLGLHMLRQCERYGTSIAEVVPVWDRVQMKYRDLSSLPTAMGELARIDWKMRQSLEYRITAQHLDLTDFAPEPGRREINGDNGCRWVTHGAIYGLEELQRLEQEGSIGPAVGGEETSKLMDSNEPESNEYKLRRIFMGGGEDVYGSGRDQFDKTVDVVKYQGVVPIEMIDPQMAEMEEQNGLNPLRRLILVGNKHTVLQNVALPWDHGMLSYLKMDCVPDLYDFWGKGKLEIAEHPNYVGNEIMNQRLDNVKAGVNQLIGIDGTRMPPGWKRRLVSQPFGVFETRGTPNQVVQRIETGDVTSSSYAEQQQLWTIIQEGTAINETLMGAPGPSRTLGEHQLKAESATKRLQYELIGQAHQMLGFKRGLAGFIIGLDRQYLPIPTYIRLIGPQTPDDFTTVQMGVETFRDEDMLFAYLPTGATEGINIQAKRADLGGMLQALTPYLPVLMQTGFNFPELIKTILKIFGHDPARFYPLDMQGQTPMQGAQPGMQGQPGMMPGLQQPGMPGQGVSFPGPQAGQGGVGGPQGLPGFASGGPPPYRQDQGVMPGGVNPAQIAAMMGAAQRYANA